MKRVSGAELSDLTGKHWKTVKKRLLAAGISPIERVGVKDLYASTLALTAIYTQPQDGDGFDLTAERARLAREQADRAMLANAEARGELLRRSAIMAHWSAMIGAMRSRLLSLPSSLAPRLAAGTRIAEVEDLLRDHVTQALAEIAGDEFPNQVRSRFAQAAEAGGTASEALGEPVGRPAPPAKPGGKRRTGPVAN